MEEGPTIDSLPDKSKEEWVEEVHGVLKKYLGAKINKEGEKPTEETKKDSTA